MARAIYLRQSSTGVSVTPLTNAEDGANTNGSTDATHGNAANGKDGGAGCKAAAQPAERASSDEAVDVAEKDVTDHRSPFDTSVLFRELKGGS